MTRLDKIEEYKNTLVSLANRFDVDQETIEYLLKTVDELIQQPASPGWLPVSDDDRRYLNTLINRLNNPEQYVDAVDEAVRVIETILNPPQHIDCEQEGQVQHIGCEELFRNIQKWQDETFPNRTQQTILNHLRDEVNNELGLDCEPVELADCLSLLLSLAGYRGINLVEELRNKFEINKKRTWEWNENIGTFTHVKTTNTEEAG